MPNCYAEADWPARTPGNFLVRPSNQFFQKPVSKILVSYTLSVYLSVKVISYAVTRCTLIRREVIRKSRKFQRKQRKIAESKYIARNWVTVKVEEAQIKGFIAMRAFWPLHSMNRHSQVVSQSILLL